MLEAMLQSRVKSHIVLIVDVKDVQYVSGSDFFLSFV